MFLTKTKIFYSKLPTHSQILPDLPAQYVDKSLVNLNPANFTDPNGAGNEPIHSDDSSDGGRGSRWLSRGAIAGIVIGCVAFDTIIITVIGLAKKSTSSGAKVANDDNSSANKISVDVRFNF